MAWDVQSWSQAFSMYASALMSANSTTKPESAGLLAHTFSVLQFAGWQPMAWATAKIKDLRTIFCQCMVSQQRVLPIAQQLESGPKGSSFSEIWGCLVWNFKKVCKKSGCRFSCSCYFCGGPHRGPNCLSRPSKGCGR